ncbi:hypothetical protein BVJ53_14035 [Lacticaseibacillus chiayiensis]|uniref:Uncharacterized protein n=1 Tax=Lacticaseibacillus chiayiensis TaxID=2100821 RepID=A0A4Q1TI60_9LACO|nr:hypothetical protein BVJ53_14035 [Lacticaseibacillus chiayiensis]
MRGGLSIPWLKSRDFRPVIIKKLDAAKAAEFLIMLLILFSIIAIVLTAGNSIRFTGLSYLDPL